MYNKITSLQVLPNLSGTESCIRVTMPSARGEILPTRTSRFSLANVPNSPNSQIVPPRQHLANPHQADNFQQLPKTAH